MAIQVASNLVPRNGGTWPIAEDIHVKGGYRIVADNAARDAINVDTLKVGSLIYIAATGLIFNVTSINQGVPVFTEHLFKAAGHVHAISDVTGLSTYSINGSAMYFRGVVGFYPAMAVGATVTFTDVSDTYGTSGLFFTVS